MRIVIFTDAYKPQINGVVTSVDLLSKSLRRLGHKVLIVCPADPMAEPEYGVLHIPSMTFPLAEQFRTAFCYSHRALKGLRRLKPDIIHCHTEFSMGIFAKIAALALDVPLVHTYHTLYEHYTHYISKKHFKNQSMQLAILVSKFYTQTCDSLIVPTEKVLKALRSYGIKREMHVVPTGLDIEDFFRERYTDADRAALRERYGIAQSDFLCVYVGRISYEKSIDMLLRVFMANNNPALKFLIVGDGPELDILKEQAKDDPRVIFTGAVPYGDVPLFYQTGDVFLNASISETQGLTFIEAMAAGSLLLVRADESLKDMIQSAHAGIIYTTEEELSSHLEQLLNSKSHYVDMRHNAVELAKKFSASAYGASAAAIYEETITTHEAKKDRWLFTRLGIASFGCMRGILRDRRDKLLLR